MTANDAEVFEALRQLLSSDTDIASVRDIRRQPSEYRSSFALEEITVSLADGRTLSMMFKDLGWHSLTEVGRLAKPAHLYDPEREIDVYREVLSTASLGTARCYGAIVDPPRQRYWLFMEKAPGAELYQHGELEVWSHAARWLAGFHHDPAIRSAAEDAKVAPRLVRYNADHFRGWFDRAIALATEHRGDQVAAPLRKLVRRYDEVVRFLASLPTCFVHGEFYASNILVDTSQPLARVCPVDWELAGIGPGVVDLAALVVGKWTDAQREELIDAYRSGLPPDHPWSDDVAALSRAVDFARLHLAVKWLGWSRYWTPPTTQAHDWLAEAVAMAEKLELYS
jgi:hypothetical protein